MQVKFKKLHKDAFIPKIQTKGSAGFDFHVVIDDSKVYQDQKDLQISWNKEDPTVGYLIIKARSRAILRTGLASAIPSGYEIQVRPRSGLAFKHGITVTNSPGTIDSDYRNEILVLLTNHGDSDVKIYNGDRIAQGVVSIVPEITILEVEDLDQTERVGGFGSTGTK